MKDYMRKFLAVLLALSMCVTLLPIGALSTSAETGLIEPPATGYGSNGKFLAPIDAPIPDSISISNRAELDAIRNNLSGNYHLTADIDLSGAVWVPIGAMDGDYFMDYGINAFKGVFDGQGYIIRNMKITGRSYEEYGLFGAISDGAIVKNIGLEGTQIDVFSNTMIEAGGICGESRYSTIGNCYNTGNVSASSDDSSGDAGNIGAEVGGICASASYSTISFCYNTGNVSATADARGAYAGGICGFVSESISNCYNTGRVSALSDALHAIAGGICATPTGIANISDCYNVGDVSAYSGAYWVKAGGICGDFGTCLSSSTISNCYNTGDVSAQSMSWADIGGICGSYLLNNSSIFDCYWRVESAQIVNGTMRLDVNKKGVGDNTDTTTPLTTSQMKDAANFASLDFDNVWAISPSQNNGYPYLISVQAPTPEPDLYSDGSITKYGIEAPSVWAAEQVTAAITANLVPSSLQSKYTQPTTRAEFCALAVALYETITDSEIEGRTAFSDTIDVNVEKAAAINVVQGIAANVFAPNDTLTREQAATMLARLAEALGYPLPMIASSFADTSLLSSWALKAVGQVQAAEIMNGVGNNVFSPQDMYTREQSIVTVLRLYDLVREHK